MVNVAERMALHQRCLLRLLYLCVPLIGLVACQQDSSEGGVTSRAAQLISWRIDEIHITANGDLTPGLPLRFEPLDAARLQELRQRENLNAIVAGARDEFDAMRRLKDWVAAQWRHSNPNPYPPWDAIEVLDWIRSGKTGGFCAQYSQVLLQSLAALGYLGRYVEIGTTKNPYAHFVMEVWSNQFNKWVLLDADYNVHFERNGLPLSALEIHDALVQSQLADVDVVLGDVRLGHPHPDLWPKKTAELYYYVRVLLKADHLTAPHENPFDRFNDGVEWEDEVTVPWEVSTIQSQYPKHVLTNLKTNDRSAFEGGFNRVAITVSSVGEREVILNLENNVKQFLVYQVRESGQGEWWEHVGSVLQWSPTPTARALEVRGVNIHGVPGPISRVEVGIEPYLIGGE